MKKLFCLLLASGMTCVYAEKLKSFNEIYNSLQNGKNIRLLINLDSCLPKPEFPNIVIYTTPAAIIIQKDHLQFANSHLTTNNPEFQKKLIIENVTYRITNNDEVNITTRIISLPDYALAKESTLTCSLKTAVKVFN